MIIFHILYIYIYICIFSVYIYYTHIIEDSEETLKLSVNCGCQPRNVWFCFCLQIFTLGSIFFQTCHKVLKSGFR